MKIVPTNDCISDRPSVILGIETVKFAWCPESVMENDAGAELKNGEAAVSQVKEPSAATTPYRYTKVTLMTGQHQG